MLNKLKLWLQDKGWLKLEKPIRYTCKVCHHVWYSLNTKCMFCDTHTGKRLKDSEWQEITSIVKIQRKNGD